MWLLPFSWKLFTVYWKIKSERSMAWKLKMHAFFYSEKKSRILNLMHTGKAEIRYIWWRSNKRYSESPFGDILVIKMAKLKRFSVGCTVSAVTTPFFYGESALESIFLWTLYLKRNLLAYLVLGPLFRNLICHTYTHL